MSSKKALLLFGLIIAVGLLLALGEGEAVDVIGDELERKH